MELLIWANQISLNQRISITEINHKKDAIIKLFPMQLGFVMRICTDICKVKKFLNYYPIWNFEDGIAEFIKWKMS
jgi:hypothetical protein